METMKEASAAERFKYLYDEAELKELAPRVQELAAEAQRTHVLFNTCFSDFGVRSCEVCFASMN